MNTATVTILMLTYNRGHYLGQAIDSVLGQTFQDFTLVIIDDGSNDDTAAVVASYHDERIRYIRHTENAGLFTRRKESLTYVTGDYVAVLDSDDYWVSPTKLADQVAAMVADPHLVVVGTNVLLVNAEGVPLREYTYHETDSAIRSHILLRNQFTHSAVLMRWSALEKTAGYTPTLAEDLDLFLQLGLRGTFLNLKAVMTAHRVHGDSMNDHGPKMSAAVVEIVKNWGRNYPRFYVARVVSLLRYAKACL